MMWGDYTLVITNTKTGEVIREIKYTRMSGNAMMDEAKYWRSVYPKEDGYTVDW